MRIAAGRPKHRRLLQQTDAIRHEGDLRLRACLFHVVQDGADVLVEQRLSPQQIDMPNPPFEFRPKRCQILANLIHIGEPFSGER